MTSVTIKRGASFTAVADLYGDAPNAVLTSTLKYARNGDAPGDEAPAAGKFTVTYQADIDRGDGTSGPGWFLTLSEADTLTLVAGRNLVMDVRIENQGAVVHSNTQRLSVVERVTEDANG